MRAVIAVLRAAGANKQKNPELPEGVLLLRSIRDINAPKLLAPDIPLFDGILSDLFPEILLPPTDYSALNHALAMACSDLNLQRTPFWMLKVCPLCMHLCGYGQASGMASVQSAGTSLVHMFTLILELHRTAERFMQCHPVLQAHEFFEMMTVRHGLMIVGMSYSGKSTIISAIAQALGILHKRKQPSEQEVVLKALNPKAVYMGQLYGQFDPVTHEWQDGVLARAFRCSTCGKSCALIALSAACDAPLVCCDPNVQECWSLLCQTTWSLQGLCD